MNDPGRNLLCVRKSDVTNRDSTFAELQGAIFRMFGEQYKKYWYINSSNMIIECKSNHNQIIFRGVNDDKQLLPSFQARKPDSLPDPLLFVASSFDDTLRQ